MNHFLVMRTLGMLLMVFSLVFLVPLGVDLYYHEHQTMIFLISFLVVLIIGGIMWASSHHAEGELRIPEGFIIVVSTWVLLSLCAAIPFILSHDFSSWLDALFEAVSGLTTTGTEVLTNLDTLPHSLVFYHQFLEFVGGLGIIILALAIMPMLGIGGMQLYRAEMPGVSKDSRLALRVSQTAQALWSIYLGLTFACILAYHFFGMGWFEAVCEAFGTVSTGGFSIHDASFSAHEQVWLHYVAIFFMIMGSINFRLHYQLFRARDITALFKNYECRVYLSCIFLFSLVVTATLLLTHPGQPWQPIVRQSAFMVTSMMSTTGLTNASFAQWPSFLPIFIMLIALVGGCAGSTSGGLKVIRVLLMQKEGVRALDRLVHPRAIISINFGGETLPEETLQSMRGFLYIFIFLYVVLLLLVMASGVSFETTFAAVTACLSNAGASISGVAAGYGHLHDSTKWILIFAMLAGRIEIMALMVLFMPSFWRG